MASFASFAFSWQNSASLYLASFCTPRPNLLVTPGIFWLPTFAFPSLMMKRTSFLVLVLKDLVEKAMATHSSTLAWKIPWTEEPGWLQSIESRRVGLSFHFHFSLSCIGEGNGNPLQCSCLENPRDSGAWWAAIYGVAQNRTRLKRLSSSSS